MPSSSIPSFSSLDCRALTFVSVGVLLHLSSTLPSSTSPLPTPDPDLPKSSFLIETSTISFILPHLLFSRQSFNLSIMQIQRYHPHSLQRNTTTQQRCRERLLASISNISNTTLPSVQLRNLLPSSHTYRLPPPSRPFRLGHQKSSFPVKASTTPFILFHLPVL